MDYIPCTIYLVLYWDITCTVYLVLYWNTVELKYVLQIEGRVLVQHFYNKVKKGEKKIARPGLASLCSVCVCVAHLSSICA